MSLPAFTEPWPTDVTHRYLTVGGATVDIKGSGHHAAYKCTACPFGSFGWHEDVAHKSAQAHAEKCRALPRPEGEAR